jgi:oxygen-dependent protoporphyrinogen oxidase
MTQPRIAIVGAGVCGLALAHRLVAANAPCALRVYEAAGAPGGHARTVREDGFLVEAGPNGFLDRNPGPVDMARELGLGDDLVEALPAAKRRFIVHGGRLRRVPDSPLGLVTSDALTPLGKLRLLGEPFARPSPVGVDETVHAFATRRVGREAADRLVDAAVSGISAGDSRELSLAAAFPMMAEMEKEHGSLLRAMGARRKAGRGPARLLAFRGGMGSLVAASAGAIGDRLVLGSRVVALARADGAWRLGLATGEEAEADRVVLAVPARAASALLLPFDPELARSLTHTPFSSVAVVALAYPAAALPRPLDGYGYLVTRDEGLATLGVVWESSLFAGRAPEGHVLLRAVLGGPRRSEVVFAPDADRIAIAREELARVLGVTADPERTWTFAWPHAIAQYVRGHRERTAEARTLAARHPGLDLVGSSYDGISFGSAIDAGRALADRILGGVAA